MWFTEEKLTARIRELEPFRYRDAIVLNRLMFQPDHEGAVGTHPPETGDWQPIQLGSTWKGWDCYVWLAADADIPEHWKGKKVVGRFDFGRTGGGTNSGFESLLFVNGHPYQGVDSNHEEVFLPADAAGTRVSLRFRLWSGLNGYGRRAEIVHRLSRAEICWLDEATDDLYYTARAVLESIRIMSADLPEREDLLALLNRAFLRVDWTAPGSDDFYRSVAEARDVLNKGLSAMTKRHAVTVRCIGHTHIDVAWLWRLKHTREKAARSFSTVLRLMELYPEYVFLQTQPQLYEYIKSDYPHIYEQIRKRVREGRWEAGGAMWLEADCNLPSGESLVRHLLYGTRFFREEFGVECTYLWLPDVFGYSWALPQILRKSGIRAFMTTKISWNEYNRMPHDTFWWRGIDGTEILTHFITTPASAGDDEVQRYTYNGKITPHAVQGIWKEYKDKALNKTLLLSYGYGDGGGGVNREMLEMRRRIERIPGLPNVETGRADDFFRELEERVAGTDQYVHVWDGELYLELHRGTYTSQAYTKRMNRKLELLYREAEWLSVMNCLCRNHWGAYPGDRLGEGWKIILRNQFHDIIPGSSIRGVYEDSAKEYGEAWELGQNMWDRAAAELISSPGRESSGNGNAEYVHAGHGSAGHENPGDESLGQEKAGQESTGHDERGEISAPSPGGIAYAVFNGASWERSDLVLIPHDDGLEEGEWVDRRGDRLPAQRSEEGWHVLARGLKPMGIGVIRFQPAKGRAQRAEATDPAPFRYSDGRLDTPYYLIEWNREGMLTRLYDKRAERDVLAPGALVNVLQVFEDRPKNRHEAWDIDIFYREKMACVNDLQSVEPVESGPLRFVVRFAWKYNRSVIKQDMIVYSQSARIDFKTWVDWHERRKLLKVAFPVDIRATEATYDIQFGNVRRPTHWNTSWDYARFETVGHQWADLSEGGYGVSLLNDCKYGYDIKDNVMRLSLIKSAMVPDEQADQGEHRFTYSLYPHEGDWRVAGTVKEAWSLNLPVAAVKGEPLRPDVSLLHADAGHVMIDAVKKAEDTGDVIVRIHEYMGARGKVTLRSDFPVDAWRETDLLERPLGPWSNEGEMTLTFRPYEIKTLAVRFRCLPT